MSRPKVHDRTERAFELYLSFGPSRTYRLVANRLGVAERTVRHWAKLHRWPERARAKDGQQTPGGRRPSPRALIEENIKIVRATKMKAVQAIAEDRVKPQFGDITRLITLEDELIAKIPPDEDDMYKTSERLLEEARTIVYVLLGWIDSAAILREHLIKTGQLPAEEAESATAAPDDPSATDPAGASHEGNPEGADPGP